MTTKIQLQNGGQRLDGTLVTPDQSKDRHPGVIFLHGMTSSEKNYLEFAERLAAEGIAALTISLRGHGTSEGDFEVLTVESAVEDGMAAYDFLVQQSTIDPERIGVCGSSVGAAIATLVSLKRPVRSLLLRVPATYTDTMMKLTYAELMADEKKIFHEIKDVNATPALQAIGQFKGAVLVVTSENDVVIPANVSSAYFTNARAAVKKEFKEIREATHGLSKNEWREEFARIISDWFRESL